MNELQLLKKCNNLNDLAYLLNFSPKVFSYILFSKPIYFKYEKFEIPKKNGEMRTILSPDKDLKKLQQALAKLLDSCLNLIEKERLQNSSYIKSILSHGFRSKYQISFPTSKTNRKPLKLSNLNLGIYSNAYKHKGKKYVLNIDLKDFFKSITFKRIVGFFCKNENFQLNPKVAILIAQIATYRESEKFEAFLPQGSPCSPVISNLITSILDNRLNQLAKKNQCTYTRYADDLTFSTNLATFPEELYDLENRTIGKKLFKTITKSWFTINISKTRLTHYENRQEVTGLVVNKKVNISKNYYRYSRTMIHSYCRNAIFHKSNSHNKPEIVNVNAITGITNHIFNIKKNNYQKTNKFRDFDSLDSIERLYVTFHFHRELVHNTKPFVICEGITDPLHLKHAYKMLYGITCPFKVSSIEEIKPLHNVMGLTNGVGPMIKFLIAYSKIYKSVVKNNNACIFLVDGDKDGTSFIKSVVEFYKQNNKLIFPNFRVLTTPLLTTYHITKNLYIVQLPKDKCIEDIYDPIVLKLLLNGRTYNPSNTSFDLTQFYGKVDLIKKVIKPAGLSIDFSNFHLILDTFHHIQIHNFLSNTNS